jgi:hypothetical protein
VATGAGKGTGKAKVSDTYYIIFSIFYPKKENFQDGAELVLGGMVLARGAANIADQLFGWHPHGGAEDFWLIFTLLGVTMSQNSSVSQITKLVP